MGLQESLQAISVYPPSPADAPGGKYAIHTSERKERHSWDAEVQYSNWFQTPSLDLKTIQRLKSLQLFTESHDQKDVDDPAAGIWTWFELAIMENAKANTPRIKDKIELAWTSHKNVLGSDEFTWLEGTPFPKDHDIFRLMEENNVISVRLCSRFAGWNLVAKTGYLVVELGSPVSREPLSFGSIASKIQNTQDAFDDINKVVFPSATQLPYVPHELFKAEMLSTQTAKDRPLRVLSLDGGGVRGLASLLMLKKIMDTSCPGKKPCDVFDMIGGTSTGGFIAIMLGRLEMTVDDCILNYKKFMNDIFPRDAWTFGGAGNIFGKPKWDAGALEKVVKQLIRDTTHQDPETFLLQDPNNPDPPCKVFVSAVATTGSNNHAPVLMRSYSNFIQKPEFPEVKVWEAARATSAAPTYFKPMTIGDRTFVDGGMQANNPLGWLWNEILQVFGPRRTTSCFLSIGTGTPLSATLPEPSLWNAKGFVEGLVGIATNAEVMNVLFRSLINAFAPEGLVKKYWRFNFGDGLPEWVEENGVWKWKLLAQRQEADLGGLDNVAMVGLTEERTAKYMALPGFTQLLDQCAQGLTVAS